MKTSHVAWNFGGLALPLLVAAYTIPHLIEKIGAERFGLLALAWGLIGYASSLDLGLGRAVTHMVARFKGNGNFALIPSVLATAIQVTLATGTFGGVMVGLAALTGGATLVRTEYTSTNEIRYAMMLLAFALPAQAMSATYRGLNEGFLNFRGVSSVRAVMGVINFAGPYVVSHFTIQLPWLVATLVLSRIVALFIFRYLAKQCLLVEPKARIPVKFSRDIARTLFKFGGWATVSGIIGPIIVQADRFLIAASISAAAVSAYVLPFEVVVQSLILVSAVTTVMFPGLASLMEEHPNLWKAYFYKWLFKVAFLMAGVCTLLALLLPIILPMWIKGELSPTSVVIGQILCIGVFFNSVGSMFYSVLHAKGRPDITAKIHVAELVLFLVLLWYMLERYGVVGAAWAWVLRVTIDAFTMMVCATRCDNKASHLMTLTELDNVRIKKN